MGEPDPLRHVPAIIQEAVPDRCASCPVMLGILSTQNTFIDDSVTKRKKTWNPFAKAGHLLSELLSKARLHDIMHERVLDMQDCEGMIEYPAGASQPMLACGIEIRNALSAQVTNQQIRTQ